jgi:hypothetical protein
MFSPRSTPTTDWRQELERAADLVVAFATLESISSVRELFGLDEPAPVMHPHRGPALRPRPRTGRPGSVPRAAQACTVGRQAPLRRDTRDGARSRSHPA